MIEEKITEQQGPIDPRIEELFKAGVQFGYAKTRRHPRMKPYIAGVKSNIEIFHLDKVLELLGTAEEFIERLGKEGAPIVWVGTKPAAALVIKETAEALGHYYVDVRWLGGTITNVDVIRKRITHWHDLTSKKESGELGKYTKQEQMLLQKEMDRLDRSLHGLATYTTMPKAMFVVDPSEEENAVKEAQLKGIPVIALLNTDCDPRGITYPIPGNDNASESIRAVLEKVKAAYIRGQKSAVESATHGD